MFLAISSLISRSFYSLVKNYIHRQMKSAGLILKTDVINGDIIEYWDNNLDKPVILLVHGFGASTEYQWYKQVAFLSKEYRLVAPNLFYFGGSKPKVPKFQVSDQVELINTLIDYLKLDPIILFGVSYGGLISVEFAERYKNRVERLVIFDSPIKYIYHEDIDTICEFFEVISIEDLFVPKNRKGLKKLFYLALGKKLLIPNFMLQSFYDNLYVHNLQNKRHLIQSSIESLEEYTQHDYHLNIPFLLIWGSTDMIFPAERATLIKDHIGSNVELQIIENGSHMPNIIKASKFNSIVYSFLKRSR